MDAADLAPRMAQVAIAKRPGADGTTATIPAARADDVAAPRARVIARTGTSRAIDRGMAKRIPPSFNALDLLEEQHAYVDKLFEQIAAGGPRKRAVFLELADCLAAHAAVEEKLFYPRVMMPETERLLLAHVEEHLAMKRVLADLLTMDLSDPQFDAKLAVLKEEVSHHAHAEEEQKLFPILRAHLDADQLASIGNDLLARFEELITTAPRKHVPGETRHAAPLPA